jgi:hypothetical protein
LPRLRHAGEKFNNHVRVARSVPVCGLQTKGDITIFAFFLAHDEGMRDCAN